MTDGTSEFLEHKQICRLINVVLIFGTFLFLTCTYSYSLDAKKAAKYQEMGYVGRYDSNGRLVWATPDAPLTCKEDK